MNREKVAWMISVLLIALLAFHLPGTMAQRESDYAFVRRLVDIHRQIANNYVEAVDDAKLEQGALEGMFGQLDPFSMYVRPEKVQEFDDMLEGSFEGVGIQLNQDEKTKQIEIITPIEGSPAFKAGVFAGDVLLKVNGEAIAGMSIQDVTKKIKGKADSPVTLRVRHTTGEEVDLTMTRSKVVVPSVKGFKRKQDSTWNWYVYPNPKIGYIRVTQFTGETTNPSTGQKVPSTVDRIKFALSGDGNGWKGMIADGMKGLILDLRFNPGGRLDQAVQLVDLFIDKGVIVSTKGRNRPENIVSAQGPGTLKYFPMVVLINEHSASASEIVAGSLMDNQRALVIGERSYGKGSVQELIHLDGNQGELKLTVAYYYLPSGRLVHKKKDATDWGVQPQVLVPADEETEKKIMIELDQHERFLPPVPRPGTTQPTTKGAAATQPASGDVQLQRAVDTMIGMVVLQGARTGGDAPNPATPAKPASDVGPMPDNMNPTSKPSTTKPATAPAPKKD
ncbi:MAG TPA: S41 family peptidase [Tepidisphaeraceae bacterium]|nr:S41 family peptidase [Tepidisphaeraceae bacterium]